MPAPLASIDGETSIVFGVEHTAAIAGADLVVLVGTPALLPLLLLESQSHDEQQHSCAGDGHHRLFANVQSHAAARTVEDRILASVFPEARGATGSGENSNAAKQFVPLLYSVRDGGCAAYAYTDSFPAATLRHHARDARGPTKYVDALLGLGLHNTLVEQDDHDYADSRKPNKIYFFSFPFKPKKVPRCCALGVSVRWVQAPPGLPLFW